MVLRWRAIAVGAVFGATVGIAIWLLTRSLFLIALGAVIGAIYGGVFGREGVVRRSRAHRAPGNADGEP